MTTSNTTHRLAASVLGIWLLATACDAATRNNAKVDKLFAQWNRTGSPGAAVVIVKDGAVVYQHGYGSANLEHRIPITPQTSFDVASVAKQFTGLSVAMLIQQGKLSLDDDIRKYLPDVPDFGKPITISNLLHHTSGLRDWPDTLALSGLDWDGPITLDTILEMVRRQRELDFLPGEEHLYSNTGYNLLAAALANATGQSFRAWTDANLFRPLGMNHTLVRDNPTDLVANSADSYAPDGKGQFHRAKSQLAAQGSSSLFITAEDMGKWLINLETARVGGRAAMGLMLQPGTLNNGVKVNYGFGFALDDYHGSPMIHHEGGWAAYRSVVIRIPEKRFAVAILSNAGNADTYGLGLRIADLYLATAPAKPAHPSSTKSVATTKANPGRWGPFLGTYRLGPGWLLTITREGDQLIAQATHESKFKMTPVSERSFFVEAYGAAVEFVRNDSGFVTGLLYRGINAPRFIAPEPTPAYLAAYVGHYWSEELRVTARIEIRDGELGLQLHPGEWTRLLPTEPDRFDTEGARWSLEFTRNAASEITEARVSGGRIRRIRYTRVTLPKTPS